MSVIHTNKTGTGFNSGQTGAMAGAAPAPTPVLLPDLVAGWALTAGPQQTLDSTGVIASGTYDLTNLNGVTFDSDGAHFPNANSALRTTSVGLALAGNAFLICYTIFPGTGDAGQYSAYCVGDTDSTFQLNLLANLGAGDDFQRYQISGAPHNILLDPSSLPRNQRSVVVCGSDQVTIGLKTSNVAMRTVAYDGGPDASTNELTVGNTWNTDNGAGASTPQLRYVYFWSGANAATIYNKSTWIAWLENSGNGRTPTEVAAYTG